MYSAVLGHYGTLERPRNGIFPLVPFHNVFYNHMKAAIWQLICNALCNAFHNAAFSHTRNGPCNAHRNDLCKRFHNVPYNMVHMSCNNRFDIFLSICFL